MESKHKNALIGALLAVVFVMAVGYAAFTQQLQITGTANVAETSSTWNVHFDETKTTGTGVVDATTGTGGTVAPTGAIEFSDNNHTADLTATLIQPGDSVKFTLTIENEGAISADLAAPVITSTTGGNVSGTTVTQGNITFEVEGPSVSTVAPGSTATFNVTATFNGSATSIGATTTSGISITMQATQTGA